MQLNQWFGLENTTCVVIGAGGLIGRSIVSALSDCGAEVLQVDRAFEGSKDGSFSVDVASEAAVDKLFATLATAAKTTREYSFINCSYPRTENWGKLGFENVTKNDFDENCQMHLGSVFYLTKKAVEFLKPRGGGSIINFGSIYGIMGPDLRIYDGTTMVNPAPYAAIKAGIVGITNYTATVFGKDGIRANVLSPGGVEDKQPESFKKAYNARTPLGKMAKPEDVAGTVAFLAGPSGKYITGQNILVDGGWTAW